MAKSIRSKRKRMLRNIKRERYAVKELQRLKTMLGVKEDPDANVVSGSEVIEFTIKKPKAAVKKEKVNSKSRFLDFYCIENGAINIDDSTSSESSDDEEKKKISSDNVQASGEIETEMDHSQKRVYNKKTMKDQFGNYPVWFNSRLIKRQHMKDKERKKKEKKIQKKLEIQQGRVKKNKKNRRERKKNQVKKEGQGVESMEIAVPLESNTTEC